MSLSATSEIADLRISQRIVEIIRIVLADWYTACYDD